MREILYICRMMRTLGRAAPSHPCGMGQETFPYLQPWSPLFRLAGKRQFRSVLILSNEILRLSIQILELENHMQAVNLRAALLIKGLTKGSLVVKLQIFLS